jgi:hypothetical protein
MPSNLKLMSSSSAAAITEHRARDAAQTMREIEANGVAIREDRAAPGPGSEAADAAPKKAR